MRIRNRQLLRALVAMAFLGSVVGVAPASQAQQATECTGVTPMTFTPGLSESPSSGTHNGRDGTHECNGPVLGDQPTGTGGHDWDGRYGTDGMDTCTEGGEGWGVANHYVPTKDGKKTIRNVFTFKYGGISGGIVSGTFEGDHFSGTFSFKPLEGDCVTAPLTKGEVTYKGTYHEYRA